MSTELAQKNRQKLTTRGEVHVILVFEKDVGQAMITAGDHTNAVYQR